MLIYVSGHTGYETALRLYQENSVLVKKQFPSFFIKRFLDLKENMGEIHIEKKGSDVYIREMLSGGFFAALWDLCEEAGCGCTVDYEKIPFDQEVIEILELFKESPMEVSSKGAFLVFSDEPLFDMTLIGFTDNSKDRTVNFKEHKRYLTPPLRQSKDIQNRKG